METPLVSILIPAYQSERWIADTIKSALAQTWPNKEIIVVDDGSRDRTFEVAQTFQPAGVQVFRQENQGASAARNHLFQRSRGQYVQWLDADDLLDPLKVESQMRSRGGSHVLLSGGWAPFYFRPHLASFRSTGLWANLSREEWLLRKMEGNLHMQTATWLVSRELTEAAGPWDTSLSLDDDGEYFCRVLLASEGVRFVPEARVLYRATGSSSLSAVDGSERKLRSQWKSMQAHVRHLRSLNDSPRSHRACLVYLATWLEYFYPEQQSIIEEINRLAMELGGSLEEPRLSWKYDWIRGLFGWSAAKRARSLARHTRASWSRNKDYLFSLWDRPRLVGASPSRAVS
ncbi:MAG: glycosyltransferase [Bryobacteraceae bacterium]|nr:glycosyltransferase [Bryobacteraceae bacterium]